MTNPTYSHDLKTLLSESQLPVLVVFYTIYCGSSRLMNSILEKVSHQMSKTLEIVKIDSEKNSDLADYYKIHALPTLLLFKNEKIIDRIETEDTEKLMSAEQLIQRLQSLI